MEELINEAKAGDEKAFTELILEISDELYKIAKARISNEEDINDAIQDTMIEAYNSIKKLKDNSKFKIWIIKILINKCNRIYRRKYKKEKSLEDYEIDNINQENEYKKVEDEISFYSLIKNLRYEERIIIILYYMEEYSTKEIKSILGIKESTINTNLYRARKKIKEILNKGEENFERF